MYRKLICIILALITLALVACSRYDESWIIGKTSSEIVEKYGDFNYIYEWIDGGEVDGNYYNSQCGYRTKEAHVGFFGTSEAEYYMISFGEDGLAYEIEEDWYIPGG